MILLYIVGDTERIRIPNITSNTKMLLPRNWKCVFCFFYLNVVNLALGFGGVEFSWIGNKILDTGIGLYSGVACKFKECCTANEIPGDFDSK